MQLKNVFSKMPAKQKNMIVFISEVVLVVVFATISVLGVFGKNNNNLPVNSETSSGSNSTTSENSAWENSTDTDSTDNTGTQDTSYTDNITSGSSSDTTKTPSSGLNTVKTWSDNQFLPNLNQPANILDYIVEGKLSNEELLMFTSLKGIVNKTQPRIYSAEVDPAEGYNTWIEKLKLKFNKVTDPYTLISKYKNEIKGIVVYDDTDKRVFSTINLATTMAGVDGYMVVSPKLYQKVQNKFNFKKVVDLRGQFRDKWSIYEYMFENYANRTTNRVIVGLNPEVIYGQVRDYAIAIGACVIYLDPAANKDRVILDKFFSRMPSGKSAFMGWWTQENDGVNYASSYGVVTLASDWSKNLSVYAGMNTSIAKPPVPDKIKLENKIYIAMIVADGDNMQYMEGKLRDIWAQPERGTIPLTWTMSPAMYDVGKPMLNYYYSTATKNDCFISGPSAYGYLYPKLWKDKTTLAQFLKRSDSYMQKMGLRAVTVWNWTAGAMDDSLMKLYADNMPSLLGITQQEKMNNPVKLFNNKFLCMQIDGAYCGELYQFKDVAMSKVKSFDGTKPVFATMQGAPWGILGNLNSYTETMDYYRMVNPNVEFVRLDQLMELQTEYLKLQK